MKTTNDTRAHAHELLDRLPEVQLSAFIGLMESIVDPVTFALRNAPIDDEPVTEDEIRDIEESHEWFRQNKGIPHAEAMRRLGLDWKLGHMVVEWTERALADMRGLDLRSANQIRQTIERFAQTGLGEVKKLQGISPPAYRLRVGNFRVRFSFHREETLRIHRVQNRKDAYR